MRHSNLGITHPELYVLQRSSQSPGSTSKHLEQLNSVREALFSQDGWGGSNVKQDTQWDVGSGAAGSGATSGAEKPESNMWGAASGGNRNDGTDLWKSTLTGNPPAPKVQPNNAWTAPANNTDFKQWGVEDDDGGHGAVGGPSNNVNGAIGPRNPPNNSEYFFVYLYNHANFY